ncbi:ABC-2 type transport system permease protein [Clostridium punense]|uniref:Transport permease protein n=1 Tax=Clostridium punense TaxID=1054297 RepID=A0ABS4KBD9_9CLOT|nr:MULTISPECIES: ABC transporter permease [Clostridium]EQB88786.1 ABC transporter [Clostridium sp. BL8]MBP2023929.1 ABC-2 type transport system permease protein [Clostridium punense]
MKTFIAMLKTEIKLSLRGMDMFIFGICLPVVMVFILGSTYGNKPAFEGANYSFFEQSFGAIAVIAICAGGVMGLPLVVSDYRSRKILKRFKVTPISPVLILAVQLAIYVLYAVTSLVLVYLTAWIFFNFSFKGSVVNFLSVYFLVMVSMFSIGIMVGGISANVKIAGTIASLLYFPMLIFSGATLPYEVMPSVLQKVAGVLPLTYGIKLLKAATVGVSISETLIPVVIMIVLAIVCTIISLRFFRWE